MTSENTSLLHHAAIEGHVPMAAKLLELGVEVCTYNIYNKQMEIRFQTTLLVIVNLEDINNWYFYYVSTYHHPSPFHTPSQYMTYCSRKYIPTSGPLSDLRSCTHIIMVLSKFLDNNMIYSKFILWIEVLKLYR